MGGSLDDCSTSEVSFGNLFQSLVESLGKPAARIAVIQRIEEDQQVCFRSRSSDLITCISVSKIRANRPVSIVSQEARTSISEKSMDWNISASSHLTRLHISGH